MNLDRGGVIPDQSADACDSRKSRMERDLGESSQLVKACFSKIVLVWADYRRHSNVLPRQY